jgi:phage gp45-like
VFASKSGVDLRFKSLTAGTNITLSSDANAITINSSGGSASDNTISARGFYVRSGGELSNEGLIVPVGSAGDPSITFEGDSDTGLFQENTNEVNITCGGNHILECRSTTVIAKQRIQVPNGSAASPTLNPTSGSNTGIFFGSGASSVGVSVLGGEVAHFGPGGVNVANKVQAEAFYTPSDGEVGPIRFEETKSGGPSYFVKTLNFDSEFFYLSSGGDGLPILSSIPAAGSGEANTASNLAGDEGVFASKSGVDLRFKSLTAGDNITLASDGNAITITGAAGGGGGGFYGVIFKETEAGGAVMRDDQLNVDSEYMYLSGGGDGKPILSLTGVPKFHSHVQAAAAVEWQVSHGLNSSRLIAQAWDDGNHLVTADKIDTSDPATAYFYFNPATAGFAQLTGIPNL